MTTPISAEERAVELATNIDWSHDIGGEACGVGGYRWSRATTLLAEQIRQAEQAARADERRKVIEEALIAVQSPVMRMKLETWPDYVERRRSVAINAIRALAKDSEAA